ncbi:uncharacterized protein DSM5745_08300 [Aspergillus mulundensis]|uniref:Cell cycle inhibitor Nif1 n=1 Tax=Aspergillus mulundensis TaxID=1810919 RepID=A0A3D8R9R2_9EURO|nr:hypothetical protein DSM5745_08300 [Aspergillus mulundensis]RDW70789.1 hypothetical protein DSM5745_08300 [Aspergillus mulundensis]
MSLRPQFSTRSPSHDTFRSGAASPRVEHFDGEIPPALSPLDAFAFQGRLLARQLEDSARRDRRMSRLPPASVARSLSRPRPGYFRSQSSNDVAQKPEGGLARQPTQKARPEPEEPRFRPQSEHPRLSGISHLASEQSYSGDEDDETPKDEVRSPVVDNEGFRFDAVRAESPEEDTGIRASSETPRRFYAASPTGFAGPGPTKASSTDSISSRLNVNRGRGLAPPASPMLRPSSSPRLQQQESSDDDYSSSNAGSTFSTTRKLSSASAMSMPHSPMPSMARSLARSPSISSEASNSSHLPRPSFNFSRPLSRSSTSLSAPIGLGVSDQQGMMNRSNKPGPIVVPGPSDMPAMPGDEPLSAVSSYIYAKYALPRGRGVPRDSVVFSGLQTPHFEWQEPLFESPEQQRPKTAEPQASARVPSPSPSRQESPAPQNASSVYEAPAVDEKLLTPVVSRSSAKTSPIPDKPEPENVSPRAQSSETSRNDDVSETVSSADSASTLRPQTAKTAVPSATITAEEHVAKGIQLHEKGSLNESTYHLRVAAKQDHPVAMLLYALACRHGWGMRPNQQEGVRWLRKAMDSVGLELSGDSDPTVSAKSKELQKQYRAQFALSVYELGVSHLNGWGVEQDKALALRCFETAGRWGDVDALAEAGYCYAEGVGTKKDMKKAAKFYREAEAKGMSMVGNSWIYKEKYMSDDGPDTRSRGRGRHAHTPEKKGRSKSRTRSLFHRKKSNATEA